MSILKILSRSLPRQVLLSRSLSTAPYRLNRAPTFSTPEPISLPDENPHLPLPPTNLPIEDYSSPLEYTYKIFSKLFRYSVFGSIGIITVGVTGLIGVHSWVEYVELKGLEEDENWSGGWLEKGGTDPALGLVGRSAVRGAWIASNWGTGSVGSPISGGTNESSFGINAGGNRIGFEQNILKELVEVGDGGWQLAEGYLIFAIGKGREKGLLETSGWRSMMELEERLADLRELMGGRKKLNEARESWEGIYRLLKIRGDGGEGDNRRLLHVTKKLGDISARLSSLVNAERGKLEMKDCENWLIGGLLPILAIEGITQPVLPAEPVKKSFWGGNKKVEISSVVSEIAKALEYHSTHSTKFSPLMTKAILSSLISLETHLSRNRDLLPAKLIQSTTLNFINSLQSQSNDGLDEMNKLYLEIRKVIVTSHTAEVSIALSGSRSEALELLESSINSTESIINILKTKLPSATVNRLLLDSCTIGAITARLVGYLYEKEGKGIQFYEKAIKFSQLGGDERGEREVRETVDRLKIKLV